jgi:hypothetical protein
MFVELPAGIIVLKRGVRDRHPCSIPEPVAM